MELFEDVAKPLVDDLIHGKNGKKCCCFFAITTNICYFNFQVTRNYNSELTSFKVLSSITLLKFVSVFRFDKFFVFEQCFPTFFSTTAHVLYLFYKCAPGSILLLLVTDNL